MSDNNPNEYFTAGEIAAIAKRDSVRGIPHTKSGMIRYIKRLVAEGCTIISRKRGGQKGGGGVEYHWCFSPECLWEALCAEVERRNALSPYEPPVDEYERRRERQREYKRRRKLPPNLNAPGIYWAAALAAAADLDVELGAVTFSPHLIRKVDRCRVRVANRKYFSLDLTGHHQSEVCVTMTDAAPDLLWVLEFEKSRYQRPGPGRLICIADANAGIARYVSVEAQQAAEAKRAAGRDRRLELAKQDAATLENYSNQTRKAGISPLDTDLSNVPVSSD